MIWIYLANDYDFTNSNAVLVIFQREGRRTFTSVILGSSDFYCPLKFGITLWDPLILCVTMRNLFHTTPYEKYKEVHVVNLIRWKYSGNAGWPGPRESREIFIISNLQNYYLAIHSPRGPHTQKHCSCLYITSIINSLMIYGIFIFCGAMLFYDHAGRLNIWVRFLGAWIYYWKYLNLYATSSRQ
jgi:hypothetical protein